MKTELFVVNHRKLSFVLYSALIWPPQDSCFQLWTLHIKKMSPEELSERQ